MTLQSEERTPSQQVQVFVAMQAKRYILKLLFLLFPIILVPITAHNYVDGRSGLIRGVRVPGTRVSYGNFAVDKYHRLQVSVGLLYTQQNIAFLIGQ